MSVFSGKKERNQKGKMDTDRDNGTGDEKGRKDEQRESGCRCKEEGRRINERLKDRRGEGIV